MNTIVWIAVIIVMVIIGVWMYMSEELRFGQQFIVWTAASGADAGKIMGLEISDLGGNKVVNRPPNGASNGASNGAQGTQFKRHEIFIPGGAAAFVVSLDQSGNVSSIGPFADVEGSITGSIIGKRTDNFVMVSDPKTL